MKRFRIAFVAVFLLAVALAGTSFAVENGGYANPKTLVSAAQLEKMIAGGAVKVVDVRGSLKYRLGHIDGALDIGVADLDVEKNGVPMMFPDAEKFAKMMSEYGIANDDFVVLYDEVGGSQAGRVAWEFLQYGHPNVALLDGAWGAWKGDTAILAPSITPSSFVAKDGGKLVASIDDVKAALGRPEFVILDVRAPAEYTGETVMKGAGKGGHIPGAVNVNWTDNMDANKVVKSAEELKKMYEARGVTPDKTIITYCQGGYRAALSAYVLKELLGYPSVIMYDGSWVEWSNTDAPVEK